MLYTTIVLSHKDLRFLLGPLALTIGSSVAAFSYLSLMRSEGADAFLKSSGAADSKWLQTAIEWAESYGGYGLFALQVAPIPIPTTVLVVTGALAKMDDWTILSVVIGSKFVQLILSAVLMNKGLLEDGQSLEDYLRKSFNAEKTVAAKKAE